VIARARLGRDGLPGAAAQAGAGAAQCPLATDGPVRGNDRPLLPGPVLDFNGHIDEFRIAHVRRLAGWIETTWNNMSDPGAFAAAEA
jgi:hypothetical protein